MAYQSYYSFSFLNRSIIKLRYGVCENISMSKLLVIDDSMIDQMIINRMLDRHGLFPAKEFSSDGESAINEIEENHVDESKLPDVIFLDLVMPEFSGFNFLERFKELYPAIKKTIHIFVITCSIHPKDRTEAEQYPFVKDYLIKPVSIETLTNINSVYNTTLRVA